MPLPSAGPPPSDSVALCPSVCARNGFPSKGGVHRVSRDGGGSYRAGAFVRRSCAYSGGPGIPYRGVIAGFFLLQYFGTPHYRVLGKEHTPSIAFDMAAKSRDKRFLQRIIGTHPTRHRGMPGPPPLLYTRHPVDRSPHGRAFSTCFLKSKCPRWRRAAGWASVCVSYVWRKPVLGPEILMKTDPMGNMKILV